jgi:hypothetical protein
VKLPDRIRTKDELRRVVENAEMSAVLLRQQSVMFGRGERERLACVLELLGEFGRRAFDPALIVPAVMADLPEREEPDRLDLFGVVR